MNINWLKNPDNVVVLDVDNFIEKFKTRLSYMDMKDHIEQFRKKPSPEGKVIIIGNRISARIFQPDLMFQEPIERGSNLWVTFGMNQPCYCLNDPETPQDQTCFFFSHKACEYYPCHQTDDPDSFNCLFCYCPLYCLGDNCGGNPSYSGGIKDCSKCMVPHQKNSHQYINRKFSAIAAMVYENDYSSDTLARLFGR